MRNIKINPLWLALLTFWVPNTIAKTSIPETPKIILIWAVIAFQIYLLYLGIERIRASKK
ncbi:MAG: hypothetical protein PWQ67_665 [Clostridia bacterium]|nr:hypothetical protein [Clostridia bacterium]MDN5322211.1 hypothetical protein [Clostridia bacterium]